MHDFYNEDLAYIHHQGFPSYEKAVAAELLSHLNRRGISSGTLIDLGCGGGRLLKMLSDSGFDLHGVDVSSDFLNTAKVLVPDAVFHQGSVYEVELPECVAVISVGEVLSYVFEKSSHQDQLQALFQQVHQQLQPNGVFFFDLIIKDDESDIFSHVWRTGVDWAVMAETNEDETGQFLWREIISFRDTGSGYQRSEEIHYQEIFTSKLIEEMLQRVGFTVQIHDRYGNQPVAPHRKVFYAFK